MMPRRHAPRHQRGVTLIEALVAMAVMAFGMLALVGVQSTLRINADMARQRAEATRMAEQELESARTFVTVGAAAGATEYDSIATVGTRTVQPLERSADFSVDRLVIDQPGGLYKTLKVTVSWTDRQGENRSVVLRNVVSRASPVLSALLTSNKKVTVPGQRGNRHPTIPTRAGDLGNDTSAFKPQEGGGKAWVFDNVSGVITQVCDVATGTTSSGITSTGQLSNCVTANAQLLAGYVRFNLRGATLDLGDGSSVMKPAASGTVAWRFNNSTFEFDRACTVPAGTPTASITAASLVGVCTVFSPTFVLKPASLASTALTAADADAPQWPALNLDIAINFKTGETPRTGTTLCYAEAPDTSVAARAQAQTVVAYFCIIYPRSSDGASAWSGYSSVLPKGFSDDSATPWSIAAVSGKYKVCRYTTSNNRYANNVDHPAVYSEWVANCGVTVADPACRPVTGNLINQNFLIIDGGQSCPTDTAIDPVSGKLVNNNTQQHQP